MAVRRLLTRPDHNRPGTRTPRGRAVARQEREPRVRLYVSGNGREVDLTIAAAEGTALRLLGAAPPDPPPNPVGFAAPTTTGTARADQGGSKEAGG